MARRFDELQTAMFTPEMRPGRPAPFAPGAGTNLRPPSPYTQAGAEPIATPGPPTARSELPPGFHYADEKQQGQQEQDLPPGFRYAEEIPTLERARMALGRAARPISTLVEAPGAILSAGGDLARRAFETSRRMAEGDPTVSAGPTFEAALLGLGGAPRVGGGGRLPTVIPAAAEEIPPRFQSGWSYRAPPPEPPPQLTSRLSYEEARAARVQEERVKARQMRAEMEANEIQVPEQRLLTQQPWREWRAPGVSEPPSIPTIRVPPEGGQVPPPSQLLPPQLVREFGAVRKGMELRERLNPASQQNLSVAEQNRATALEAALRPHLNSIEGVNRRTNVPMATLESLIPSVSEALSTPAKAASVANWMRVYERAARAKFTPQAKASLDLATKNLNNNLGTDITIGEVLGGQ